MIRKEKKKNFLLTWMHKTLNGVNTKYKIMNHWIMDYETLKNCFVAVFKHYKTDEMKIFSIYV